MKKYDKNLSDEPNCLEQLVPLTNVFQHCSPIMLLQNRFVCRIWNDVTYSNSLWQKTGAKNYQDFVAITKNIKSKNLRKMVLLGFLKLPLAEKISQLLEHMLTRDQAFTLLSELCLPSINLDFETYEAIIQISGGNRNWYMALILANTSPQDLLRVFAANTPKTSHHYRECFFKCWGIIAQQLNLVSITALHNIPDHASTYSIKEILSENGVKFMKEGYATFQDLIQMPSSHYLKSLLVPNAMKLFKQGLACFNDFKDSGLHPDTISSILSDNGLIVLSSKWFDLKELLPLHWSQIKALLSDNAVRTFKKHGLVNKKLLLSSSAPLDLIFSDKIFLAFEQDIMRYTWLIPILQAYYSHCVLSDNCLKSLKSGWLTHAIMEDIASGDDSRLCCDCSTLHMLLTDQGLQAAEKGWISFAEAIQLHRDGRYDVIKSLLTDGTRPSACTIC